MQLSLTLDDDPPLPRIRDRLLAILGPRRDVDRHDPVSQLVKGILSSETRDEVSAKVFARLSTRYPCWDMLRQVSPRQIKHLIWEVNRAELKAEQLPRALRMAAARSGDINLDFLADWEVEDAMQWLIGLPGVGPKVAASVLNFSTLRKRALVVDRHLLRLGKRLGLLSAKADFGDGYNTYMKLVPDSWGADDLYEFHWLMKPLSQAVCTAGAPACRSCPLRDLCPCCGV